ncbi:MAG: hypothetical protein KDG52_20155 [Rhodocyclaceae bacterium]|nr:hypothetical protein [Rhodocyclaceae bacterium]
MIVALAFAAVTAGAVADDSDTGMAATAEATPLVALGATWRAEMRRLLKPEGASYLPTSAAERRAISREERHRLREDIRANGDIYELRERPGRGRR